MVKILPFLVLGLVAGKSEWINRYRRGDYYCPCPDIPVWFFSAYGSRHDFGIIGSSDRHSWCMGILQARLC